jgi:predicted transcriptional regulator
MDAGKIMTTITIALPDERVHKITELADEASVAPEELLRASVEEWLARPQEDFAPVAAYLLQKNAELYRLLTAGEIERDTFTQWLPFHTIEHGTTI